MLIAQCAVINRPFKDQAFECTFSNQLELHKNNWSLVNGINQTDTLEMAARQTDQFYKKLGFRIIQSIDRSIGINQFNELNSKLALIITVKASG